jgi:uncharacterized UPF0160 family protein
MDKKIYKLITHDGSFHSDDIFACAALSLMLTAKGEEYEITRTRDEEKVKSGDYVFDIGGIHDEGSNRFDHHQVGGAGKRESEGGVEYASFGLVWKKFGTELAGSPRAAEVVDKKLVAPVDAWDNALDLVDNKYKEVSPYFIQHIFLAMTPTWREGDEKHDEMFFKCVEMAKVVLSREIIQAQDFILAEELVLTAYKTAEDKRIIVLDKGYPFQHTLNDFPEPMYVVYPRKTNNWWGVKTVRQDPKSFNNRKSFPAAWGGMREDELQKITDVPDAVFCHRGLFMVVAKSKEGAIKLAQLALEA